MSSRRKIVPPLGVPVDVTAAIRVWDAAGCADVDPELFFPERGRGGASRAARAICAECPVRELCLDTFGPVLSYGVVGGLTAKQRESRRGSDGRAA